MKNCCCIIAGLVFALHAFAQRPAAPGMSDYKDIMKMAQQKLDSVKKEHPELANIQLPKQPKAPDLEKLKRDTDKSKAALSKRQEYTTQQREQSLPVSNASIDVTTLAPFGREDIAGVAKQMLPVIIKGLDSADITLREALDRTVNDTNVNVAGTGIMFMGAGVLKYIPEYLICKDVISNPDHAWKLNDLGIILRNERKYKQAVQVFQYACNNADSAYVIKTNLAWATFYYGDFAHAKKYFNEALLINPKFGSALEGLALIAYREGNLYALFTCLQKEVKSFGSGGAGPSAEFTNICGGVMDEQKMDKIKDPWQAPPPENTSFDNADGGEGNEEVLPEGNESPPDYRDYGGLFASSIEELFDQATKYQFYVEQLKREKLKAAAKVASKLPAARLATQSKYDADGNRVGTYDFSRFYRLFDLVHEEFESRMTAIYGRFDEEMEPLLKNIALANIDLMKQYQDALNKCTNEACAHETDCNFAPKFKGMKGADLGAISEVWTRHFKKVMQQTDWYVNASSPWIKRMLRDDWNGYMNAIREADIRDARLNMYLQWVRVQTAIGTSFEPYFKKFEGQVCITQVRVLEHGPDPNDVPLKKLKTAPDYCDPKASTYSAEAGFGSFSADCKGWKVTLGTEDNHLVFKKVIGKHKEDDFYRGGVAVGFGVSKTIKADGALGSSASIKASAHLETEAGYTFNSGGEVTGKYAELDLSMGIKGEVTTGNDNLDGYLHTAKFGHGMDVHVELSATKGPDGYGSWGGTMSGTKY